MALQVGHTVPDHVVQAYVRGERDASEFSLSDHHGRWVVLNPHLALGEGGGHRNGFHDQWCTLRDTARAEGSAPLAILA
jgi:hypothetical protein